MLLSATAMTQNKPLWYAECHQCPFYQYEECLIAPSSILLYFYCPVSEGSRPLDSFHVDLPLPSTTSNPAVAEECSP